MYETHNGEHDHLVGTFADVIWCGVLERGQCVMLDGYMRDRANARTRTIYILSNLNWCIYNTMST